MKNAKEFVKSLKDYGIADLVSRGVNKDKQLNKEQQELVVDMMSAANAKDRAERLKGYEDTLLAMQVIIFVNTL